MADLNPADYLRLTIHDGKGWRRKEFVRNDTLQERIEYWLKERPAADFRLDHDKEDFGENEAPVYP